MNQKDISNVIGFLEESIHTMKEKNISKMEYSEHGIDIKIVKSPVTNTISIFCDGLIYYYIIKSEDDVFIFNPLTSVIIYNEDDYFNSLLLLSQNNINTTHKITYEFLVGLKDKKFINDLNINIFIS